MTFPNEKDAKLAKWLDELGISRVDKTKLLAVFTHPSYKGMDPTAEDYERLEFIGDAVLGLVSAEELVTTFIESEGVMTEKRKALVNNETLSHIFERLKMGDFLRAALKFQPSSKDKANVVEALFGAVFLDLRYDACRQLWDTIHRKIGEPRKKKVLAPSTPEEAQNREAYLKFYQDLGLTPKNAKNTLQELCQKQNLPLPEYEEVKREGPDHEPFFQVKVTAKLFNKIPLLTYTAIGEGRKKGIAEIKAAEKLCDQIFLPYSPQD